MLDKPLVAVGRCEPKYPELPPFNPDTYFPEYPFSRCSVSDRENVVYRSVRNLLIELRMDLSNCGLATWNPFRDLVKPGDTVLIKPNFVLHFNAAGDDVHCVITHGSVIRAVMDYIFIALRGKGEIIIADAPQMNADFSRIKKLSGLDEIVRFYQAFQERENRNEVRVCYYDLRRERAFYRNGVVWRRISLAGDPKGYRLVDLKDFSEVALLDPKRMYGADYYRRELEQAHSNGHHAYRICQTLLDSDVIISVPKLKTHSKVGVTLNLKNMVGISGNKNHLMHYQIYSPKYGGDEFSEDITALNLDRFLKNCFMKNNWRYGKYMFAMWRKILPLLLFRHNPKDFFRGGNWHGNDTAWRMALDLGKIVIYADKNGKMCDMSQRKFFSLVDGIMAGEGNGPLAPSPRKTGLLIGGYDPVVVDAVSTDLMGFDVNKIPLLRKAWTIKHYKLTNAMWRDIQINGYKNCEEKCVPPDGWIGHIEK